MKRIASIITVGLLTLASSLVLAQELTEVTLVQAHSNIAVGEEVFLYAVPYQLGYFEDEGLEVNIEGAAGGTAALQVLQSGSVAFATTQPELVLNVREHGGDPIAIFNLKKRGGYGVATLPDSPIETLEDLEGAVIGVSSLGTGAIPIIRESLAGLGLQEKDDYTFVATGTGGQAAAALRTGRVDALGLWDAAFGVIENSGVELDLIDLPILDHLAGFSIATTDRFIAESPAIVEGMCRAVAKGLAFTVENPEAAIRIFHEVFPQTKATNLSDDEAVANDVNVFEQWLANATAGEPSPYGHNFPEQWQFTHQYYTESGMLQGSTRVQDAYSNQFIEGCNDFDVEAVRAAARSYGQ